MKSLISLKKFLIWNIVLCMIFPSMLPILAYAEQKDAVVKINDVTYPLFIPPYTNELGLMVDARTLLHALGLIYEFDNENKSLAITDTAFEPTVLMHNATEYHRSGNIYDCKPYFYVENAIPMIELGFFCSLFDVGYKYDEASNVISLHKDKKSGLLPDNVQILSTQSQGTADTEADDQSVSISGSINLSSPAPSDGLDVQLLLFQKNGYLSENRLDLGTVHFEAGETKKDYSYDITQYTAEFGLEFALFFEAPKIYKYGYYNQSNGTANFDEPLDLSLSYDRAKIFGESAVANLNIGDFNDNLTGNVSITDKSLIPDNGLDVKLILRTAYIRTGLYTYPYNLNKEIYELGTVHLSQEKPSGTFSYDVSGYYSDESPCYALFYEIEDTADKIIPRGYYGGDNKIYTIDKNIIDFSFNSSNKRNYTTLYLNENAVIDLNLPEFSTSGGSCGDGVAWRFDIHSGTLHISGNGAVSYSGSSPPWNEYIPYIKSIVIDDGIISIPSGCFENIETLSSVSFPDSMISIGRSAFSDCKSLTSITIPYGITNINHSTFEGCTSLTSITIPNSVTSIGDNAFKECLKLTSITLPNSLTSIGYYAFSKCESLTDIALPENLENIERYCFAYCESLTNVTIEDKIKYIGSDTFFSCSSLKSVTLPDSLTAISGSTFAGCEELESITIPANVTTIGDSAFRMCSKLKNINLPDSVTHMGSYIFYECSSLNDIALSHSIQSIYECAFGSCSSLTDITIPASVDYIDITAFTGCSNLQAINIDEDNSEYSSADGVLFNKSKHKLLKCPQGKTGDYSIPDHVIIIDDHAFSGSNLTNITIPDSVADIGEYAFSSCELTSVEIPNSVERIGEYAFLGCELTSVEIPDSVTVIDNAAFIHCDKLKNVIIGNGLTAINLYTFQYCTNLESVTIGKNLKDISGNAFWYGDNLKEFIVDENNQNYSSENGVLFNKDKTALILCPSGKTGEYIIPDGVTNITSYAFYDCKNLTNVTIPDSVTEIKRSAFANCTRLTSINLPENITNIPYDLFYACRSLTSITIPDGVTTIGDNAFRGCRSLTQIIIPDSVTSIGEYSFATCHGLKDISLGNGIKSIPSHTFEYCSSLTDIIIPDNVKYMGSYAFEYCKNLKKITFGNGIKSVSYGAFKNCQSLTSVIIPDNIKYINYYAFEGCSNLKKAYIGIGVTEIQLDAFSAMEFSSTPALTDIYYAGSKNQWEEIEIYDGLSDVAVHYNSTISDFLGPQITHAEAVVEDDIITVNIQTDNVPADAKLFAAGYDNENKFVVLSEIIHDSASFNAAGVATVKIFIWDSLNNMKPLCQSKTIEI